jgi:hypothetical protein
LGDAAPGVLPHRPPHFRTHAMNNIIYIVGLIVVVIAVLSFFGLR